MAQEPVPGQLLEHVPCRTDPAEHYTLYLPSAYDTTRRWPLLLVFDPGARALRAAQEFQPAAVIHPERPGLWIELAAERVLSGQKRLAIAALQRAVEAGYEREALRTDARFERLGGTEAFQKILK
ncbi:MAG: hypothetical protein V7647_1591 [Acidobacteriota bacterium]|jgi:hypothetical protein